MASAMATFSEIVEYTNKYLRIRKGEDWPNALNGLQIENSGNVTKIGAAVDVSTRVLRQPQKTDEFLIVHHGLLPACSRSGALPRTIKPPLKTTSRSRRASCH